MNNIDYKELMHLAKEASKFSYSPYSKFAVGAAVIMSNGNIYTGCNVENSSYGMAICAERCAIAKAVSSGDKELVAVAIYSPNMDSCYPCGACRQVMYEFQKDDEDVLVLTEKNKEIEINKLSELLPCTFKL